jgi:hypothetical protein
MTGENEIHGFVWCDNQRPLGGRVQRERASATKFGCFMDSFHIDETRFPTVRGETLGR